MTSIQSIDTAVISRAKRNLYGGARVVDTLALDRWLDQMLPLLVDNGLLQDDPDTKEGEHEGFCLG